MKDINKEYIDNLTKQELREITYRVLESYTELSNRGEKVVSIPLPDKALLRHTEMKVRALNQIDAAKLHMYYLLTNEATSDITGLRNTSKLNFI